MTIRVLADAVASQIAAGEVIERPASVIKELIENSIDAGADQVTVHIEEAGKKLIEITDNGCGIAQDELETAVKRHATSKLQSAEDLFHIHTLGFRGEALAAAGSVSHMTITTRTESETSGAKIRIDGGTASPIKPISANIGTIVMIEDLFYNVPARLKFLKTDATERSQIESLVSRYALAYPSVRWQYINEKKTGLQTTGNGIRREILAAIYGLDTAKQFLEISLEEDDITVSGFISPVALVRSNRKEMNYFINGRWVQDVSLNAAVMRAYQTLIMVGKYPIVALFIDLKPEDIDVNVHPAKAEVRFRSPDHVFGVVHRAIRRGLIAQSPIPMLNQPMSWPTHTADHTASGEVYAPYSPPAFSNPAEVPLWRQQFPTADTQESAALAAVPDESSHDPQNQNVVPAQDHSPFPESAQGSVSTAFPILRWIGQIGATYIIAEGPDGLYLIDQHAAHERVLFEKMLALENEKDFSQLLLEPEVIQLPPWQASILEENMPILAHLGFLIETFGPSAFRITAMPSIFGNSSPVSAIRSVVEDFEEDETPLKQMKESRIAARVCKRMAVKAGQILSETEQRQLLRDLEACRSPRTCPHGRPTMIHLSINLLEKQFGRRP